MPWDKAGTYPTLSCWTTLKVLRNWLGQEVSRSYRVCSLQMAQCIRLQGSKGGPRPCTKGLNTLLILACCPEAFSSESCPVHSGSAHFMRRRSQTLAHVPTLRAGKLFTSPTLIRTFKTTEKQLIAASVNAPHLALCCLRGIC